MSSKGKANKDSKQPQEPKPEPKVTPQPEDTPKPQPEVVSVVLTRRKVYPDGGVSYSVPGMKGIVAFKPNVLIPGAATPETLTVTFPAGFDFIRQPPTKAEEKKEDAAQPTPDERPTR